MLNIYSFFFFIFFSVCGASGVEGCLNSCAGWGVLFSSGIGWGGQTGSVAFPHFFLTLRETIMLTPTVFHTFRTHPSSLVLSVALTVFHPNSVFDKDCGEKKTKKPYTFKCAKYCCSLHTFPSMLIIMSVFTTYISLWIVIFFLNVWDILHGGAAGGFAPTQLPRSGAELVVSVRDECQIRSGFCAEFRPLSSFSKTCKNMPESGKTKRLP